MMINMNIDLVLPSGKIIKQEYKPIREFANNDYSANDYNPSQDKWWEREPKIAYSMMSAAPNQLHVNSENW